MIAQARAGEDPGERAIKVAPYDKWAMRVGGCVGPCLGGAIAASNVRRWARDWPKV